MEQTKPIFAKNTAFVSYRDFGAVGDGITNDIKAIAAAHEYANAHGLPVKAEEGAVYYISDADEGAVIQTDTDWTGASFVIDDTEIGIDKRDIQIFTVTSRKKPYCLTDGSLTGISHTADNLGITLPQDSVVILTDASKKRYRRFGQLQNPGSDSCDILVAAKDGTIDTHTPLNWDYEQFTSVQILPMDDSILTIRGGTFTTIANTQTPSYHYYDRGIRIARSRVLLEDLAHDVVEEGDVGNPYHGFLAIHSCADVLIRNVILTPHKTYMCQLSNGLSPMGSYDIDICLAANLTLQNVTSSRDITDESYSGMMGGNFHKNLILDGCRLNHVDAHQGCYHLTIKNSTIGKSCISVIGKGQLLVENCTVIAPIFFYLKIDYGSVWDGDILVRNCKWIPMDHGWIGTYELLCGRSNCRHDFGYPCGLPKTVTIEGLVIDDTEHRSDYDGICLFSDFDNAWIDDAYENQMQNGGFPFGTDAAVTISGFHSESGMMWKLSPNMYMFRKVKINHADDMIPRDVPTE